MNENGQLSQPTLPPILACAHEPLALSRSPQYKLRSEIRQRSTRVDRSHSIRCERKIREMERTQCHTLRPVKSPQRLLLHRLAIRIWRIVSPRVLISKLYANVFCHAFVAEKTRKIGISLSYFIERWSACILFVLSYFRSLSFFLSFNSFLLIIQAKICLFFPPFFLNFFERERRNALIRFSCSLKCTRGGGTCS